MTSNKKDSDKKAFPIQSLTPEILINVLSDVAVTSPETFFRLFRLNIFFKNVLNKYRQHILQIITQEIKIGNGVSKYIDYIRKRLPRPSTYDSKEKRAALNCCIRWGVEGCFDSPKWLIPAIFLKTELLSTLLLHYKHNMDPNYLVGMLIYCEFGSTQNIDVYRALQEAGISLSTLPTRGKLMLVEHLKLVRILHHPHIYREHLEALVLNGFCVTLDDIIDTHGYFGCLDDVSLGDEQLFWEVHKQYKYCGYTNNHYRLKKHFRIDLDSIQMWRVVCDQ